MEDIIDKKVIIVNGSNLSNIQVNIEPIKNVTSIKLLEVYADSGTIGTNLETVYMFINDYGLKTLYDNNNYKHGINVFNNITFYPNCNKNECNNTGIISDFNLDTQNYVFNPIVGDLNRLNISFKKYDFESNILENHKLHKFSLELCIYSKRMKVTMF
jgi:hypothetical protein|tara:strand:- start:34 stop:507 length:474 start_codon:yes stop_codon:yes gene_type:complete